MSVLRSTVLEMCLDVGVVGREGAERVVGIVDVSRHGLDEAVEFRARKPVNLFSVLPLIRPGRSPPVPGRGDLFRPVRDRVGDWHCHGRSRACSGEFLVVARLPPAAIAVRLHRWRRRRNCW